MPDIRITHVFSELPLTKLTQVIPDHAHTHTHMLTVEHTLMTNM